MRRVSLALALVAALAAGAALSSATLALAQSNPAEVQGSRPECVTARAEARMQAYGFDHFVAVRNGCSQPVTCRVSTSVNPSPATMRLAPGEADETLMWRGSPANTFVANVECTGGR